MKALLKVLRGITEVFNIIAIIALLFMLVMVCANVIMRYIFNSPINGTFELTQMVMICLTPSIAVTIIEKQNVWVDVLTSHFNRIGQLIIDIITLPISIVMMGLLTWQAYAMVTKSFARGTHFTSINLFEWPFRVVFMVAMGVATLSSIAFTIERFSQYKNGGTPVDQNEVDEAKKKVEGIDLSGKGGEENE